MTTEEIIKNLTELNEWRRGGEGEMPDPKLIGITIDEAINKLKPKESKEDLRNRIYFEMRNGKQTNKMKTKRL